MLSWLARKKLAPTQPERDLIFDLGLHRGLDSEFYLSKGFRTVGLEADPLLCKAASERLGGYGDKFIPVNKALAHRAGQAITFHTVPDHDDWGSLTKEAAGKGIYQSVEITVPTTDLHELFDEFGVPYYVKCDLEGADMLFRDQLARDKRRPAFVSLEVNEKHDFDVLGKAGYDVGQIINQWMHPFTKAPNPALEGEYIDAKFNSHTSGLFGLELPREKWKPLSQIKSAYLQWQKLKRVDDNLAPGWLDLHACNAASLP